MKRTQEADANLSNEAKSAVSTVHRGKLADFVKQMATFR